MLDMWHPIFLQFHLGNLPYIISQPDTFLHLEVGWELHQSMANLYFWDNVLLEVFQKKFPNKKKENEKENILFYFWWLKNKLVKVLQLKQLICLLGCWKDLQENDSCENDVEKRAQLACLVSRKVSIKQLYVFPY